MSEDVRSIARGTGLLLPATLVGYGLLVLLDVYVNGVLDTADYGLFGAIKRVLQLVGFVVLLGMENAVIRFVAMAPDAAGVRGVVRTAFGSTLVFSVAVGLVLAGLADVFAGWVDASPETVTALRIGALSLPFAVVRLVAVAASQGRKVVTHRALVMFILWPLAQFAGVALFAHALGLGIVGVMWAYVGAMALGAIVAVALYLRIPAPPGVGTAVVTSLAPLLAFAWPMWLHGIVMGLYTWMDQVLLAGIRSPEAAGIYGPVATLAPLFGVGLGALNGMFAPIIAERRAAADIAGLERLYRTVTRWAVALAVPPLVVAAVAPEAVLGLWPNGSAEAATALRVTCLAQLICTSVGSVNYLLIMAGHQRATLWNGIPAVVLNIGLSFLWIPAFGVTGAALANGVATVTANVLGLIQVWLALRIHPFDRSFLRPLFAGVPAVVVVWAVARLGWAPIPTVAVAGVGAGVVFLGALRLLGLDADDRLVTDAIVNKLRRR